MPTNITEVSSYTATIAYPLNTELADESSLKDNFIQGLTNRTKFLKDFLDGIVAGTTPLTNLTVSNEALIDDIECETLFVTISATIGNNALDSHTVNGLLNCAHALQTSGSFVCIGNAEFNNPVTMLGDAHIKRRIATGTVSATYGVDQWDEVQVLPATLSSSPTYTISNVSAGEGSTLVFYTSDVNWQVDLSYNGGGGFTAIKAGAGQIHWRELVFTGGSWRPGRFGRDG